MMLSTDKYSMVSSLWLSGDQPKSLASAISVLNRAGRIRLWKQTQNKQANTVFLPFAGFWYYDSMLLADVNVKLQRGYKTNSHQFLNQMNCLTTFHTTKKEPLMNWGRFKNCSLFFILALMQTLTGRGHLKSPFSPFFLKISLCSLTEINVFSKMTHFGVHVHNPKGYARVTVKELWV